MQFFAAALQLHTFMHQQIMEAALAAPKQAQHVIRIPAAVTDEGAAKLRQARAVVAIRFALEHGLFEFCAQLRRDALVGVDGKYPVAVRVIKGAVLLRTEAGPVVLIHFGAHFARDGSGVIRTAGIDHNDLVRPRHRLQTFAEVGGFVAGDENDGKEHVCLCWLRKQGRQSAYSTIRGASDHPRDVISPSILFAAAASFGTNS